MIRTLACLVTLAALAGAVLAGCGGGGSSRSSTQAGSTPATGGTGGTPSSTATIPSALTGAPAVQRALTACRSIIAAAPTLSTTVKAKVEGICNKAAHGDVAGARQASREVCTEVVNAIPALAGALRERALAQCRSH